MVRIDPKYPFYQDFLRSVVEYEMHMVQCVLRAGKKIEETKNSKDKIEVVDDWSCYVKSMF